MNYNAGTNGTVSGTTPQTVNYNASGSPVYAVPATGYHFVNWSDGLATTNRTDLNVTSNLTVTASFAINTYTLTYNAGTNGTVSGITPQTVNYNASGSLVYAVPATGYHFVNWSDNLLTTNRTDANVTSNLTVTASFAINSYTLTYNATNGGSISGATPQTVAYLASGSAVTAVASNGFAFTSWSDGVLTSNRTDVAQIGGTNVTALFSTNNYTLTYNAGTNGTLSGNASQSVPYLTSGTPVTAIPNPGYHFSSWSDGLSASNRTDIAGIGGTNVTASFGINSYTLTYNAAGGGYISGTTPQTVAYLSSGTPVTAVASNGYAFTSWSDGILTSNRTDTALVGGTNVIASFALSTPSPVILTNVLINGNQLVLSWPAGQGWTLQNQTNDLAGGLSTNWSTVALPASAPPYTNTINPATPSVFYRLKNY